MGALRALGLLVALLSSMGIARGTAATCEAVGQIRFICGLVSPEDLVLLKLLAGRPKDFVDVGDILFIQGQLDQEYLHRWATQLGISSALEEARRKSDAGE